MINILIGMVLLVGGWQFGIKPPMFLTDGDIRAELGFAILGTLVMLGGFFIIYSSL